MNCYFDRPTIKLSPADLPPINNKDYFHHDKNSIVDNGLFINIKDDNFESDPPITISNKLNVFHHHPLSKQFTDQKVHSAPLLQQQQQNLAPPSILVKNVNSSPSVPRHIILKEEDEEKRRPSVITFSSDNPSIFYDAATTISEYNDDIEDEKVIISSLKEQTNKTTHQSFNNKWRRPSIMSRISSAYTNKTAAITIDYVDLKESRYLHESIVICAIVSKRTQQQQKYHHQNNTKRRRPLKWKEYKAVITQSGYLELYNVCHCNNTNNLLHMCLHFRHNTNHPQYKIDLHPSVNNKLFEKSFLINHNASNSNNDYYKLSLMSPIDFSWCLSSSHTIFYFQSNSIHVAQHWYRSLYTALPSKSKLALPKNVDLMIPQLSTCIRLPISELIKEEDENVDLRKVRDSALVLLHRNGNRPTRWNKRTVGLCWKYKNNEDHPVDWVLKPSNDNEENITYLIEARLIEKTHELQLRYLEEDLLLSTTTTTPPSSIQSCLVDQSSSSVFANKLHSPMYVIILDHFLLFFESKQDTPLKRNSIESLCCFKWNNQKNNKTSPTSSDNNVKHSSPRSAIGIIDLLKISDITEERSSCDNDDDKQKQEVEASNHHVLHLNDYSFQVITHQPTILVDDWSTRLVSIQKYYSNIRSSEGKRSGDNILQSSDMYIKIAKSKYHPFQQKFCLLTKNGDLCVFTKSSSSPYKIMDFSISLVNNNDTASEDHGYDRPMIYVYSGEECCDYITKLPLEWSTRIFDNGIVVEKSSSERNKPNQCCFVIHSKDKDYVFLTRSQQQKEAWVQSICSFLK